MKKIFVLVFLLIAGNLVLHTTCSAQPGADNGWTKNPLLNTWQYVGSPGISSGEIYSADINLATSPIGQPFVAYADPLNSGKVTVMKFDGTTWVTAGTPGFSPAVDYDISLAFNPSGQLYLAFSDAMNANKATVMKYDGIDWIFVGTPGFSTAEANFLSLACGPSGQPYLAFRDVGIAYTYIARVMKFDGINWVDVGSPGISEEASWQTNLAFSPSGQPYVAYIDNFYNFGTVVKKFDGTNWVFVGPPGFIPNNWSFGLPLVINSSGEPFIEYENSANEISVMKFDGTNWAYVGTQWFSGPVGWNLTMAISPTDQLYVALTDDAYSDKATVMNYDGTNWVTIGTPGFTPKRALHNSLAIDNSGIPYLAFVDSAYGNRVSVMKFDSFYLGIHENQNSALSVYPNPASSLITIDLKNFNSSEKQIEIYNVEGKMVYETQTYENKMILNVKNYPSGVYFIKLTTKTFNSFGKFCKE
jgi:Secretion system C-terminal sorting domain